MLELGGKWCSQAGVTYKSVFESLGFRHVSVDWNGEHGALALDLRMPLTHELKGADIVTNFGTTEHISDQTAVWQNIHSLTKPGGVYVGQTPYHDGNSWWWHGEWYPTEGFFESCADLNGWKIERMYRGMKPPHENLYVRMVKGEDCPFTMPDLGLIKHNEIRPR